MYIFSRRIMIFFLQGDACMWKTKDYSLAVIFFCKFDMNMLSYHGVFMRMLSLAHSDYLWSSATDKVHADRLRGISSKHKNVIISELLTRTRITYT